MVPPGREGPVQPLQLDGDTTRASGASNLNSFESPHRCRLWISVESVSNSHATEVDTPMAAMNGGEPSKATLEQFDRPPRLAKLDRARGSLDLDELNCAEATWPALATSLAD